jgi:hypothetical protein
MKWFKHDTDAHTDLKMQSLIRKYGLLAYGFYWILNELIGRENDETFKISAEKEWKFYIINQTGLKTRQVDILLEAIADLGLIDKECLEQGILSNKKLLLRADEYTKRVRRVSEQSTDNVPLDKNRIDKKRIEKNSISSDLKVAGVDDIMKIFYKINPTLNWGTKTNRKACEDLIKKFGLEDTKRMAEQVIGVQGKPYTPVATTPYQMKEKLAQFAIYFKTQKNKAPAVFEGKIL